MMIKREKYNTYNGFAKIVANDISPFDFYKMEYPVGRMKLVKALKLTNTKMDLKDKIEEINKKNERYWIDRYEHIRKINAKHMIMTNNSDYE